jgi:S1-C subfamily serine protease
MGSVGHLALLLLAAPFAAPLGGDLAVRQALHAAGVVVETTGCSGVVAEDQQIIVTARHCVRGESLQVRLSTGSERTAWVGATSDVTDQAVLFLEQPSGVQPLELVRRRQIPGTVLYFEGNPGHPRFQSARLERLGVCPSLPNLPDALFTSIQGIPGDSGAPLVDGGARVVGLVHGGAQCHIATPSPSLARLVDEVLDRDPKLTRSRDGAGWVRADGDRDGACAPRGASASVR